MVGPGSTAQGNTYNLADNGNYLIENNSTYIGMSTLHQANVKMLQNRQIKFTEQTFSLGTVRLCSNLN